MILNDDYTISAGADSSSSSVFVEIDSVCSSNVASVATGVPVSNSSFVLQNIKTTTPIMYLGSMPVYEDKGYYDYMGTNPLLPSYIALLRQDNSKYYKYRCTSNNIRPSSDIKDYLAPIYALSTSSYDPNNNLTYITPQYRVLGWLFSNQRFYLIYIDNRENRNISVYSGMLFFHNSSASIYETFNLNITSGNIKKSTVSMSYSSTIQGTSVIPNPVQFTLGATTDYMDNQSTLAQIKQNLVLSCSPENVQYTSAGAKTITVSKGGPAFDTISVIGNATINVVDDMVASYSVVANSNSLAYYVGLPLNNANSTFLKHYSLKKTLTNAYKTLDEIVQSSLEYNRISPKVPSEASSETYTYTYDNKAMLIRPSQAPYGIVSYQFTNVQNEFDYGDTISEESNIKYKLYLIYSNNISLPLTYLSYDENSVEMSTNADNNPIQVGDKTPFQITYSVTSSYFTLPTMPKFTCSIITYTGDDKAKYATLVNAPTKFEHGDTICFSDETQLIFRNSSNQVIQTISGSEILEYISDGIEYSLYGTLASPSCSGERTIIFTAKLGDYEVENVEWTFYVGNYKLVHELTTSSFYCGGSYSTTKEQLISAIKTAGLSVSLYDDDNSVVISEVTNNENTSYELLGNLPTTSSAYLKLSVSYVAGDITYNTQINVNVIAYELKSISAVLPSASDSYYDNSVDKFHLYSGLTIKLTYSDNSTSTIENNSDGVSYTRNNETLVIGESNIIYSADNTITINYSGKTANYAFNWTEDAVSYLVIEDYPETFVLGNRLSKYAFTYKVIHISSKTEIISSGFTYANQGLINTSIGSFSIVYKGATYTVACNMMTFANPTMEAATINLNGISTTYNNLTGKINLTPVTIEVTYTDSEYTETLTYSDFTASSTKLTSYVFDGSTLLNLPTTDFATTANVIVPIVFTFSNHFTNTNETISKSFSVIAIADIIGIGLNKTFTDYHIGDKFLNENDDTTITLYYKDSNNVTNSMEVLLRSGIPGINIYPVKNTIFTKINPSRAIKITSATNSNATCEYAISVTSKYNYSTTKTHNIVAIKLSSPYTTPSNNILAANTYVLVGRYTSDNKEATTIDENGARVLNSNVQLDRDTKVYGYLDDILDKGKVAQVILFEDYIPPVEASGNITVKFPCYVSGNADKINKCHFGIFFGNNNAKNRLFLSGNKDYKNYDWYSGQVDSRYLDDETMINGNLGYFEDTSYCSYGESDNEIIGYSIVSNDKLLVLKSKSDKETTVYFRTPTLVTALDNSGNAVTSISGNNLYQEEFALVKGNNSVAGLSNNSIINFNGDTLFISSDNNLVGLDLTGIVGDNQRYANSRSYFIDNELKDRDLKKAWLWSNNKYLFIILEDKVFITHFETISNKQYEWWQINIKDIQAILEIDNVIYFGNSQGELYKIGKNYADIKKIFAGQGSSALVTVYSDDNVSTLVDEDNTIVVEEAIIKQMDEAKQYYFKILPKVSMYSKLATITNNSDDSDYDFYIDNDKNCLSLRAVSNGEVDFERLNNLIVNLGENQEYYFNDITQSAVSQFEYSKAYKLKKLESDTYYDCYKVYDPVTNEEMNIANNLYKAMLCLKLNGQYEITSINKEQKSFKLKGIDIVKYNQANYISQNYKAEILSYSPVEAFYITKPYTMGSLDFFKTIWQWTLTNDSGIPSEVDIAIASNKVPYEDMKTISSITKATNENNLEILDFSKLDFDKNVVPRTYTQSRVMGRLKFICFGFKNYNNTNSVLSSMSIIYTLPSQSYGGD